MGFKSAKSTRNVNQSNGRYKVEGIIFPSRFAFSIIESIDRNLRFLYSPAPPNNSRSTINYSVVRDNEEEFKYILDRVEDLIIKLAEKLDDRFYEEFVRSHNENRSMEIEEVIIINNKFSGIIAFFVKQMTLKMIKKMSYQNKFQSISKGNLLILWIYFV